MLRRSLELGMAAASTAAFISAATAALSSIQTTSFFPINPSNPEYLMLLMVTMLAVMSALCLIAIIGTIVKTEREMHLTKRIECYHIKVKGLSEVSQDTVKCRKS